MASKSRPSGTARPGTLSELIENLRLAWRLIQDQRVSPWLRYGVPALVGLYLVLPVDFLPDVVPGLGQLDDLAVFWLGLQYFLRTCPSELVKEHRAGLRGQSAASPTAPVEDEVVDGSYRVVND